VQLAALGVGERVLLAVDHALPERGVELAKCDLLGGGAERLEDVDRHGRADLEAGEIGRLSDGCTAASTAKAIGRPQSIKPA
jgi:hypothetical protein